MCSRNDIIANVGALVAAGAVVLLHSKWPDILVGMCMDIVFLNSALSVLKESLSELQEKSQGKEIRSRKITVCLSAPERIG